MKVSDLRRLLDGKDAKSEVLLAVDGYEGAGFRPELQEVDGFVLLRLSAGSEILQVLDECDIIR